MALAYTTSSAALACGRPTGSCPPGSSLFFCKHKKFMTFSNGVQPIQLRLCGTPSPQLPSLYSTAIVRAQQVETSPLATVDVSNNCIQPFYRSVPDISQNPSINNKIKLLFISESNICRSVYAEAILNSLIKEKNLQDLIECSSKGTRDYNVGEKPDARVMEVAEDLGLDIKDHTAKLFDCARDVVDFDLVLVMDKFTASDTLKDVTIFETIDKKNSYSWKIRRLGDFCSHRKIEDIDDPLYGNTGGEEEMEELYRVSMDIRDSCNGLVEFLSEIHSNLQESETFKQAVAGAMGHMAPMDWLKPPMLQRS